MTKQLNKKKKQHKGKKHPYRCDTHTIKIFNGPRPYPNPLFTHTWLLSFPWYTSHHNTIHAKRGNLKKKKHTGLPIIQCNLIKFLFFTTLPHLQAVLFLGPPASESEISINKIDKHGKFRNTQREANLYLQVLLDLVLPLRVHGNFWWNKGWHSNELQIGVTNQFPG